MAAPILLLPCPDRPGHSLIETRHTITATAQAPARPTLEERRTPEARPLSLLGLVSQYRRSLLLLIVVFVAGGIGYASVSPVTYTAQGQLLAAGTSVNAAAVPSFAQAGQSLAQTYSRVFSSDDVQRTMRAHGYDPSTESVTASPIASSSVILIEAQAPSRETAIRMANTGVRALSATVASLLDNSSVIATTRTTLQTAYKQQLAAQSQLDALDKKHEKKTTTAYAAATSDLGAAEATVSATRSLLSTQVASSVQANGVRPLTSAQFTSSTSTKRFQIWGSIGLIAAIVLWLLLALLRSRPALRHATPLRRSLG